MTRPRLSVLILTYNRERMLADCLDSVMLTTADCEIAVFDDASTDGTTELVRSYADRDPRISYFRQPANVGLAANVEAAARMAKGEFIAFLADDDSVEPGNYEHKVAILEAYPAIGFVYSLAYATDENLVKQQVIRRPEYLDYSYIGGRAEFGDLISGNYIYGPGVVIRRSLIGEGGVMDPNLPLAALPLSDWDLYLRLMSATQTAFINEPLVNVRFHGTSMSLQADDMAMGMIAVWRKWLVDSREPAVLDKRTWERMQAVFLSEVQRLHGTEPAKAQACVAAFEDLRRAATANATEAFAKRSRIGTERPQPPKLTPDLSDGAVPEAATSLVWTGPVWGLGGMGSDLRALAASSQAIPSISLRLEDFNWGLATAEPNASDQRQRLNESLWRPLSAGDSHIHIWQGPLEYFRPRSDARVTVARVAVGEDSPPTALMEREHQLQALWLPSQYQCDLLANCGFPPAKLRVLPSSVDLRDSRIADRVDLGTGRHFNFIAMIRVPDAALDSLLHAFTREFRPHEDVALMLVLRTPPGTTAEQLVADIRLVIQQGLGGVMQELPPIVLKVGPLAEDTVAGLLGASQAYVEPRPSTWGRGVLEAMACGLPIVGSATGSNAELLNSRNSFTSPYEITAESLAPLMRQAFSGRKEARRRGVRARADVAQAHSSATVGARLRVLVEELREIVHPN
jgi:glycosyltransferase involved in cell wall biosynthesis